MGTEKTTLYLMIALLAMICLSVFDISSQISRVSLKLQQKGLSTIQTESHIKNLSSSCQDLRIRTNTCLSQAQACLKILNSHDSRNKKFESQVQQCQNRNFKNSKRNAELKDQLDSIQTKMNNMKQNNEL